jgi:hypothetical protein
MYPDRDSWLAAIRQLRADISAGRIDAADQA